MKHSSKMSRCSGMPRNYYSFASSTLVRCKGCKFEQKGRALRCPKCGDYMLLVDLRIPGEINTPLKPKTTVVKKSDRALALILA